MALPLESGVPGFVIPVWKVPAEVWSIHYPLPDPDQNVKAAVILTWRHSIYVVIVYLQSSNVVELLCMWSRGWGLEFEFFDRNNHVSTNMSEPASTHLGNQSTTTSIHICGII